MRRRPINSHARHVYSGVHLPATSIPRLQISSRQRRLITTSATSATSATSSSIKQNKYVARVHTFSKSATPSKPFSNVQVRNWPAPLPQLQLPRYTHNSHQKPPFQSTGPTRTSPARPVPASASPSLPGVPPASISPTRPRSASDSHPQTRTRRSCASTSHSSSPSTRMRVADDEALRHMVRLAKMAYNISHNT